MTPGPDAVVCAGPPVAPLWRRALWRLRDASFSPWARGRLSEAQHAHSAWRLHLIEERLLALPPPPPLPRGPAPAESVALVLLRDVVPLVIKGVMGLSR
jgi:hypothetical protein